MQSNRRPPAIAYDNPRILTAWDRYSTDDACTFLTILIAARATSQRKHHPNAVQFTIYTLGALLRHILRIR